MHLFGLVLALLWSDLAVGGECGDDRIPELLWWTPFTGDTGTVHECGSRLCMVTENRSRIDQPSLAAVLFYGSNFEPWDVPLPRSEDLLWALLHEESPKNAPIFCHDECIGLFNVTSTFRSGSDLPLTLQYLDSVDELTSADPVVPFERKASAGRAPLVYLASGCDNPLQRDQFVRELRHHIAVDSYGACLNNRPLPASLRATPGDLDSAELDALLAPYLFYLALENAACADYVTEKLWRPLRLGVVPVYAGAPNVRRWLPNNDSALLVADYASPRALARHLRRLAADAAAYSARLRHKRAGGVENARLLEALAARRWAVRGDRSRGPNFVEAFQCRVCELAWARREGAPPRRADSAHYGCPRPSPLLAAAASRSWWAEQWDNAAIEARVLRRVVGEGRRVSRDLFYERVLRLLNGRDEL